MKFNHLLMATMGLLLGIVALGCTDSKTSDRVGSDSGVTGKQYLSTIEPANSIPVGEARDTVEDGASIAIVGRIGGSADPFVEGLAAFTIVDKKVKYCPPEEGCPTPWDYCCTQAEVKQNIATVKIVDENGKPVAQHARQLLGVKELDLVTVEGTVKRDQQGNLTLNATSVFKKDSD